MDAGQRQQLLAGLEADAAESIEPEVLARLRRLLGDPAAPVVVLPHGTVVVYEPPVLRQPLARILEVDRHGTVVSVLGWGRDGQLHAALTRLPDRSWIAIEPGAAGTSGSCDRLRRVDTVSGGEILTVFEPLEWAAIDRIPTLAEPARLPPGAGTAVLNLIAAVAVDQRQTSLRYRGPYPTEQLFLTLLETFRYEGEPVDPLAEFMAGRLAWRPAPHERLFDRRPGGPCVQLRDRVERVVHEGVSYGRADWQAVRRHAPRRVRERDAATIACSLCAFETVIADRVLLTTAGELIRALPAPRTGEPARPLPLAVWPGVVATVIAGSAPPLGPFIRAAADGLILEWDDLDDDLVAVEGNRVALSSALRVAFARRLATEATRHERLGLALGAVTEIARLVGDNLRVAAQRRMLALSPPEQHRALAPVDASADPEAAVRITAAVEALLGDAAAAISPRAG